MKKLYLLTFILFNLLYLGITPPTTYAANCTFTKTPNPPTQAMNDLNIHITSGDLPTGPYKVRIIRPNLSFDDRTVSFDTHNGANATFPKAAGVGWIPGQYKINFYKQDSQGNATQLACSDLNPFTIKEQGNQANCQLSVTNEGIIHPSDDVKLDIENIKPDNDGYDIWINNQQKKVYYPKNGSSFNLEKFNTGSYSVEIRNRCGIIACNLGIKGTLQCNPVTFKVFPEGSNGNDQGGCGPTEPGKECSLSAGIPCGTAENPGIQTAIGCVPTNPNEFIKALFNFSIAIGGGIAFLMMVWGAVEMITSAGNPEALKNGQQRFTSAIIGILFIIFSVILLKIIGIDILGIDSL